MQVENYVAQPGYHQGWDERMRSGLFWEPIANSPPSYILEGDDGATGKDYGGEPFPPALEYTLSWLGAIEFGAVNNVNFVIEPVVRTDPKTGIVGKALNMPAHVNAVGDYARIATKLLGGLLPDLVDPVAGRPFSVAVEKTSVCTSPATLPAWSGRPAVDFSKEKTVVAKGVRQRWTNPHNKEESWCGWIIVANLCSQPSFFTLRLAESEVPQTITYARHQFDAFYNTTIQPGGSLEDIVPGFGTSILRLGCEGWSQKCDGTGRVC